MGGAVSSGESNDDLIDNLLEADYIKSPLVEQVFRAVDRALYYTQTTKINAYKDLAWKDGNLHLSAPCIYSEVMENIHLEPGMSFLNVGSGTGYLSTMCGLLIGRGGVNHGIELYPDVVEYARNKQEEFLRISPAIDMFDFCPPEFVVGNCLDPILSQQRYDRIYCGAACPEECIRNITELLKIGGICVIPINDSLVQITRVSEDKEDRKSLLPVSFANLISPKNGMERKSIRLPDWNAPSLQNLCRSEIRSILRNTIMAPENRHAGEEGRKKRRRRRQDRRRASTLLVVQRRRSGVEEGETGFVAVAYSVDNNSSDEEDNRGERVRSRIRGNSGEVSLEDDEMEGQQGESDEEDDNFELPDLDDDLMQLPEPCIHTPTRSDISVQSSAPVTDSTGNPESSNAGSSSSIQSSNNASSTRGSSSTSVRNRGLRGLRERSTRQGVGTDCIFGRLREIYRRREQQGRSNLFREFEHNLQHLSSLVSTATDQVASAGVPAERRDGEAAVVADMEEDHSVAEPGNSNSFESNAARSNVQHMSSPVWSYESFLENLSSTSSTSEEDDPLYTGRRNLNGVSGSAGTCVVANVNNREEASVSKKTDCKQEDSPEKLKNNPFSTQLKTKIKELPLPPSIKVYLNYNQQF